MLEPNHCRRVSRPANAAIYCARRKLNFKMVAWIWAAKWLCPAVNNWRILCPGFELSQSIMSTMEIYGVDIEGWR